MRAAVVPGFGQSLVVEDRLVPEPGLGRVVIRIPAFRQALGTLKGRTTMKLITAIVRPEQLDDLIDVVIDNGGHGMTVTEVRGFGRQFGHFSAGPVDVGLPRSRKPGLLRKIRLDVLVLCLCVCACSFFSWSNRAEYARLVLEFRLHELQAQVRAIRLGLVTSVSVYPNPARDYVNVTLSTSANGNVAVRLFNQSGQLLIENRNSANGVAFDGFALGGRGAGARGGRR